MIHVTPQPEPSDFADKVATPGSKWLLGQPWYDGARPEGEQAVPPRTKWKPCWTKAGYDLYKAYGGVCAYLGIRFEYATGASTVDHFLPKHQFPGLAYSWSNFRLSSLAPNRRKGQKTDILDPFEVGNDWFDVDMLTGAVRPNPALPPNLQTKVRDTAEELDLNNEASRKMRRTRILHYFKGDITGSFFKHESPFLWHVLNRLGYL